MGLERRTFLQQVGLALLTLGIEETGLVSLSKLLPGVQHYLRTVAQTSQRKIALLVGVNEYPQNENLNGCVTDVELQKELLIARFGFNPKDILTLTNREATREKIETAFVEHLREQVKEDDVVVFHFSGYGSRVKIASGTLKTNKENELAETFLDCLVPSDGILSTKGISVNNDLLLETLFGLGRSLSTNKLSMILDTSFGYTKQLLQGNLRSRSFPQILEHLSPEELALREQLKITLGKNFASSINSNIILLGAGKNQIATEGQWQGFSSGLFTYALTQYLWEVTPASKVQIALYRTTENIYNFIGKQQKPTLIGSSQSLLTYYLLPNNVTGAEGVVKAIDNNGIVSLKLTGLPIKIINNYGANSCLALVPLASSTENVCLQIRSREGLTAKAQVIGKIDNLASIQPGQLVQELVRVFPRNLGLIMALDSNLERIERVDATSAFANIPAVALVTLAGEHYADCLLGKIKHNIIPSEVTSQINIQTEKTSPASSSEGNQESEVTSSSVSLASYGLFSVGETLIPNTLGKTNEAVKAAVSRLASQLNSLLAVKWLDLTVNEGSSSLPVEVTLELAGQYNSVLQQRTTRPKNNTLTESWDKLSASDSSVLGKTELPVLNKGTAIRFRLTSYDSRQLYAMMLGIDSDGNVITFYAPQINKTEDNTLSLKDIVLEPNQQLIIPQPEDSLNWKVSASPGIGTFYVVFSIAPFSKTLQALSDQQNFKLAQEQTINIIDPLEVTRALLEDLHINSAVPEKIIGTATDVYALDVNSWVTFSFVYEVGYS
jgi:hypothetical protein